MNQDIEIIKDEAIKAREIILKHGQEINVLEFGSFPNGGGCLPLSEFLGSWIDNKGIEGLQVVIGKRKKLQRIDESEEESHAWLEYEDYIIDVTGDQFTDFNEKVFVSIDRTFHNKFEIVEKRSLDKPWYDGFGKFIDYMSSISNVSN